MLSPGTSPPGKCGASWKYVCSAASTTSHSTASSEWTDTGPFTAAIIGTSMASIWSTRRLPSQMMRSHTAASARPSASGFGPSPRPMNVSPVPVRITTWFSRSDAMALNSSGSSACGRPPQSNARSRWCMRMVSTPASSRLTSAVEYRSLYSWSSIAASCHVAPDTGRGTPDRRSAPGSGAQPELSRSSAAGDRRRHRRPPRAEDRVVAQAGHLGGTRRATAADDRTVEDLVPVLFALVRVADLGPDHELLVGAGGRQMRDRRAHVDGRAVREVVARQWRHASGQNPRVHATIGYGRALEAEVVEGEAARRLRRHVGAE